MDRKRIGKTFFIPASGSRNRDSSQLYNVLSIGFCWSSAPGNATTSYALRFETTKLVNTQLNMTRAFGFSVRPVQE